MTVLSRKIILLAIFGLISACGGGGGGGGGTSQNFASVISVSPSPIFLSNDSAITVTFNQSINTAAGSWQLSGDLASESDGGVWSASALPNDTLTISPTSTWLAKPGRSVSFIAVDPDGVVLASFALEYDVYRGSLYYVDGSRPDDSGDGSSPESARKFIHTAIADAVPPATVLVTTREYQVDNALSTQVVLRANVSLYGGYSADYTERNLVDYPTIIEDVSTSAGGLSNFNNAIFGNGAIEPITSETLVDGFIIKGTTQPGVVYAAAVVLEGGASPTLNNNQIIGPDTNSQFGTSAVLISFSSPVLSNNSIYGGNSPYVSGVLVGYGGSPILFNNIIHGGNSSGFGMSLGVVVWGASPIIRNNTIFSGQSEMVESGILIQIDDSVITAQPTIDNNIIFSTSEPSSSCITETYAPNSMTFGTIQPVSLQNNDLYSCEIMYQDIEGGCSGNADGDNSSVTCSLEEMNSLTDIIDAVGNNISIPADFIDVDGLDDDLDTMGDNYWHLSATNPTGITEGGLNGYDQIPTWSFNADADGANRPASGNPWSIGAYEPR